MKKPLIYTAASLMLMLTAITVFALAPKGPSYIWDFLNHDFGKIKKNHPVTVEFKFKNSGDAPLVIRDAKASCGCTVADYSKSPVAPAALGFVKLTFNAANVGKFTKTVDVISNVSGDPVTVNISGEVVE